MDAPHGTTNGNGTIAVEDEATVTLKVRVADAQGLRLKKGGEVRLVITLRTSADRAGATFGAKVTPWQEVPENAAPVWRAREACWTLPAEVCYEAEFIDSAALAIELMQRGHDLPEKAPETSTPTQERGAWPAFGAGSFTAATSLRQRGFQNVLRGGVFAKAGLPAEKQEVLGALRLPLGKRLVCPADFMGREEAEWVQLQDSDGKVKGTLLLELIVVLSLNPSPASLVAQAAPKLSPRPVGDEKQAVSFAARDDSDSVSQDEEDGEAQETSPNEDDSESESDDNHGGGLSDTTQSQASTRTTQTATPEPAAERRPQSPAQSPVEMRRANTASPSSPSDRGRGGSPLEREMSRRLSTNPYDLKLSLLQAEKEKRPPAGWRPQRRRQRPSIDGTQSSEVNIFTINHTGSNSRLDRFRQIFRRMSRKKGSGQSRMKLRSMLDPTLRQQRKEAQKWRQWHEVFCILNEIEHELAEICALLSQAASSMRCFGEAHSSLQDCVRLAAFMRDAMLYMRSEADVPRRVEDHLDYLVASADEYRGMVAATPHPDLPSVEEGDGRGEWAVLEDLQIDLAVILESAVMTAQQALAEYKTLHCRLELLVTEYEPVCRLELESEPVFMPLIVDEGENMLEAMASCMPEQAVEWSVGFSQRVGAESKGLEMLVKDLENRARQVKNVSSSLRNQTLQCIASGKAQS